MPASFVGFVRISAGVDQSNLERFSTRASFGSVTCYRTTRAEKQSHGFPHGMIQNAEFILF